MNTPSVHHVPLYTEIWLFGYTDTSQSAKGLKGCVLGVLEALLSLWNKQSLKHQLYYKTKDEHYGQFVDDSE